MIVMNVTDCDSSELAAIGVEAIVAQGIAGSTNQSTVVGAQVLRVKALNTDGRSKIYVGRQREVAPDEALAGPAKASAAELGVYIKEATAAQRLTRRARRFWSPQRTAPILATTDSPLSPQ